MAVTLACGIVVSLFLFHAFAVEPEYELAQPVSVNEGGQPVMLPAGQTVTVIGSPSGDTVMIRIVLPNGSLSMAQILFELLLGDVAKELGGPEARVEAVHQLRAKFVGLVQSGANGRQKKMRK